MCCKFHPSQETLDFMSLKNVHCSAWKVFSRAAHEVHNLPSVMGHKVVREQVGQI